ncbi:hypothetical protein TNCV_4793981 [Trichonephila clavipes]|nr:hypothetical protein TNCV_4793981 [Trichonephila clavipes]
MPKNHSKYLEDPQAANCSALESPPQKNTSLPPLVYPLNTRPDAVGLYPGCTPGKRRAWFLPDHRHTASLVRLSGG